ncbi:MAG: DNA polymerase III subunit beta [Actinomycetota bacterium]|nr:DNA polymerase III subunit beta [Actinomycetota bacterium]
MEFHCERDTLLEGLTTTSRAVASRAGNLPVLAGVKLDLSGDRLVLSGTDLDLTITASVKVAGAGDGVTVIPARLLNDIVRALEPGAVQVEADDEEARISSGRSQFSVRVLPSEDFPRATGVVGDEVKLQAGALSEALRQVVRAASSDDARPILTGVLMAAEGDGLRLVATDSYRLAVRDLPGMSVLREGQSVLVPSKALGELTRTMGGDGEVTLRLGERDATFESGDVVLTTRLIEGEFPNYRQLIPESHPNRLTVGREALLDAVRRVKLLAREATPVRVALRPDGIALAAVTQDVGEAHEELDAKYEGAEMVIAFNPEYLADGVEAVEGDEVALETVDSLKPAVVRSGDPGEGDDYLYLLMPVRVT